MGHFSGYGNRLVLLTKPMVAFIQFVCVVSDLRMRDGVANVSNGLVGGRPFGLMDCADVACCDVCYPPHGMHFYFDQALPRTFAGSRASFVCVDWLWHTRSFRRLTRWIVE